MFACKSVLCHSMPNSVKDSSYGFQTCIKMVLKLTQKLSYYFDSDAKSNDLVNQIKYRTTRFT